MNFLSPNLLWGLLTAVPLIAVYFLKVRPRRRQVTAFFLWQQVFEKRKSSSLFQRLRNALSLILMLLTLTAAVFAAAGLHFQKSDERDLVVIIDASPSMRAKVNGKPLIAQARSTTRDWIKALNGTRRIALALAASDLHFISHLSESPRDLLDACNHSAKIKHVIGLTDGQTPASNLVQLCQEMADASMTVSTVAMGDGAARELLAQMAEAGRGRYYETNAPENVPQIFTRETMQASRSAIKEDLYNATAISDHPVLNGFTSTAFPPVLGYVMARPKPTAQVLLALESGDPLLAIGRYGIGTGVCCTADLTERWGGEWLAWGGCGKFWAQVIRGVLKRADSSGIEVKPTLTRDNLLLDIRRTDEASRPLSGIHWQPNALDDTGKSRPVILPETGVGRYQARVSIADTRQLTFRLHDTEHGNAKLLQWLRPCPAEYCLNTTSDPALTSLTAFSPATLRADLSPVRLRGTLVPLCCFLAISAMLIGLVLRRI